MFKRHPLTVYEESHIMKKVQKQILFYQEVKNDNQ